MSKEREALKLALEYLRDNQHYIADNERHAYVMQYNAFVDRLEALAEQQSGIKQVIELYDSPEQPAQLQDMPKIGCVNHDCDKCKAQQQEPVAVKQMMRWVDSLKRLSDNGQHMKIPSGLSAGTCWELAIELEQFLKSPPASKPWQRLTEAEVTRCWNMTPLDTKNNRFGFYLALEAKLREKNAQPSKPWVGLTEQERNDLEDYCEMIIGKAAFEAIEAKLREKNA